MRWSMPVLPYRSSSSRFRQRVRRWPMLISSLALCLPTALPAMTLLSLSVTRRPARSFAGVLTSGAAAPSAPCCRRPSMPCSRSRRRWSRSWHPRRMRFPPSRSAPSRAWSCVTSTLCARPTPRTSSADIPCSWALCFRAVNLAGTSSPRPSPKSSRVRRSRSSMPCSGPRPRARTC